VAKGYEQIFGLNYNTMMSPTAQLESFRILLHVAATKGWDIQQLDIKTAFLYRLLPEDDIIYMEQSEDFCEPGHEDWIWELQQGLYGMKQSGCIWNKTLNAAMVEWGFTQLACEWCMYYQKNMSSDIIIVAIHINDFISISNNASENEHFKAQL
jgi:hypothetical protein